MKRTNIIVSVLILMFCMFGVSSSSLMAATSKAPAKKAPVTTPVKKQTTVPTEPVKYTYTPAKALDIVKNPNTYLNKRVKITARFDKFSSLGLDYKPALRSSDKYIAFLIRRDDAENDIPLSELKNFMKRETAEKYIDLETDDVIEYSGLVFSNALGDAWLEVEEFKIITSKTKEATSSSK